MTSLFFLPNIRLTAQIQGIAAPVGQFERSWQFSWDAASVRRQSGMVAKCVNPTSRQTNPRRGCGQSRVGRDADEGVAVVFLG
jgi:hypothetical protein